MHIKQLSKDQVKQLADYWPIISASLTQAKHITCSVSCTTNMNEYKKSSVQTKINLTLLQCLPIPIKKLSGFMSLWMKFLLCKYSMRPIICKCKRQLHIKATGRQNKIAHPTLAQHQIKPDSDTQSHLTLYSSKILQN